MNAPAAAAIRVLPERIKNQIAAGEVVERPASLVKELVENALDAGARAIRVDLEEGGVRLVRVVDDGCGMSREDLALAFVSHATSKLTELDDLGHIASLGFRGEALASIGSVARARILSRRRDDPTGAVVEDEGGRIREVVDAGAPIGTTVEVRDLFFNTPARRAFLRRTATELARALDVLQRLALAHPGVGFVVTHDRARVLDVEAEMDLAARVRRLFGAELADSLVEVEAHDGTSSLRGLVAPPRFARADTSRQAWSLNGRPLKDRVLIRCLQEAYRGFQVERGYPTAFLGLSLDPSAVDVNVHPTKSEVRFRDERRVFSFLLGALRAAVARTDMATPGARMLGAAERRPGALPPAPPSGRALPFERRPDPAAGAFTVREVPGAAFEPLPAALPAAVAGPFLQVARTYLVRALADGFEIVDQHALHERVTYEALKRQLGEGGIEVQRELVHELVDVTREELALLEGQLAALAAIGVELAVFGPTTIAVHGLPALLRRRDAPRIVGELARLLERGAAPRSAPELLDEVIHSMACRASVMAGDELDEGEIRALLERAAALEHDQTCPHGRPTRVRFTLADLERAFHRR